MKYKISLSISALCFFMALLIFLAGRAQSQEALADRISPNILRFHVLAERPARRSSPCGYAKTAAPSRTCQSNG